MTNLPRGITRPPSPITQSVRSRGRDRLPKPVDCQRPIDGRRFHGALGNRTDENGHVLEVLGDVRLAGPGGVIPLASRRRRDLLAALALERDPGASTGRLAELLWGDAQPADAAAALHNQVSRLRRLLPPGLAIVSNAAGGYRLEAGAEALDVARFEAAWARRDEPDASLRLALLEEAVGLWRGIPYIALDDDRARAESVRLAEIHAALVERRAETLLELGRADEAEADLAGLRRDHPFRESTVAVSMRVLVAAGRQSDALAVYRELRDRLVRELGLSPSPWLRDLEGAVLREEISATPRPPGPVRPTALPLPTSSFHGRQGDLEAVVRLVEVQPVVTLTGSGGVGKSRLALHVARAVAERYRDGAVWVELAKLDHSRQLGNMVATALGVVLQAGQSAEECVVEALSPRRCLLVLDNCEHVITAAARLAEAVSRSAPGVAILATSRERLDVDGEHVWPVSPLEVDGAGSAAVELFVDRCRAVCPAFHLDPDEQPLVNDICRRLDGLPLAIELAAARVPSCSLAELAGGLEHRFELLNRGRRTSPSRHRSLWAVVDWSVRQLDVEQEAVLRRVSVFAGSFTSEGAAAVCSFQDLSRPVGDLVADLVERSLVTVVASSRHTPTGDTTATRYRLLETVRAYGRHRLAESGEIEQTADRHADWVLAMVTSLQPALADDREPDAAARLETELAELRAGHRHLLARGHSEQAYRLAAGLHIWAWTRGLSEVLAWAEASAVRFAPSRHPSRALALGSAATGAWQRGDLARAGELVAEARQMLSDRADAAGTSRIAAEADGDVALFAGRLDDARRCYLEAYAASETAGDSAHAVMNLANAALAAAYAGSADGAIALVARARAALVVHPAPTLQAFVAYAEAEALASRHADGAVACLDEALDQAGRSRARFVAGVAGLSWLTTHARAGDIGASLRRFPILVDEWHRAGAWTQQWTTLRALIEVFVRVHRPVEAARLLGAMSVSRRAAPLFGEDAARMARVGEVLAQRLGPDLDAELEAGRELDDDGAVVYALERLRALPQLDSEDIGVDLTGW